MPIFSFATTYTAILTGSILLMFILLLCHNRLINKVGYRLLFILSCMTLLRFLVPLEFSFTITKRFPPSISHVISRFRVVLLNTNFFTLSLWNILEIIWGIGIVVSFIWNILQHWMIQRYVTRYGRDITNQPEYSLLLEEICLSEKRQNCFRIYELPRLPAPAIWMNHNTPCILLPDSVRLSQEDMYFVFRHEMAHFFHGDFLLKGVVQLICIIYWWNPICILIKRRINILLEMRIDHYAAGENISVSQQYVQCMLKLMKNVSVQPKIAHELSCSNTTISFFSGSVRDLEKRIKVLLDVSSYKHYALAKVITLLVALGIYVLSYAYIFEAYYLRTEIMDNNYVILNNENSFIVQTDVNTYKIYYQGEYYYTTDSLDNYNKNIKIYTIEEEISHEK